MTRKIATPEPIITRATDTEPVGEGRYRVQLRRITIGIGTTSAMFFLDGDGHLHRECGKCGSTGFIPHYAGIHSGVCFDCGGTGTGRRFADETAAVKATRQAYLRAQAADRKRAAQAAEREARDAAWRAAHAELVDALSAIVTDNDARMFRLSGQTPKGVAPLLFHFARTVRDGGGLSDRENEVAATLLAEHAAKQERLASKRHAGTVGDRITITGTVVTALTTEPGQWGSSRLIVIEGTDADEGVTAKFFTSARWAWSVERDETITVIATVKTHTTRDGVPQTELARPKRTA